MSSEIKLSIILPVYNVESYINQCLESILPQLDNNTELIIVDDCSPDRSIDICEDVTEGITNVYIKRRGKNGGLSAARNTGIEEAKGEYIWFVDSDDYIENNAVSVLLKSIEEGSKVDIVQFNHRRFGGGQYASRLVKGYACIDDSKQRLEYMCKFLSNSRDAGYEVWRRIYRLDLIQENNIKFEPNKEIFAEDICFNLDFLRYCKTVESIEDSLYCYRIRENSIMNSLSDCKLHEVQLLAWRNYIYQPDLFIKKNYNYIYAAIMQVRYNDTSFEDLKTYCNTIRNVGLVIEMCRQIRHNLIRHVYYFGKKGGLVHWMNALIMLFLLDGKEAEAKVVKRCVDKIN